MKKWAVLIIAIILMVALTGCGGGEPVKESTVKKPSTGKIPYVKFQVIKKQFKQLNDMFIFDPVNDEIISAMAKPEEFKGDRGVQLEANLKIHETKLVAAKRFFDKKSDNPKETKYNQLILQAIDKKTQAYAYALNYLKSKDMADRNFFVNTNSEAVVLVEQAEEILADMEADVE